MPKHYRARSRPLPETNNNYSIPPTVHRDLRSPMIAVAALGLGLLFHKCTGIPIRFSSGNGKSYIELALLGGLVAAYSFGLYLKQQPPTSLPTIVKSSAPASYKRKKGKSSSSSSSKSNKNISATVTTVHRVDNKKSRRNKSFSTRTAIACQTDAIEPISAPATDKIEALLPPTANPSVTVDDSIEIASIVSPPASVSAETQPASTETSAATVALQSIDEVVPVKTIVKKETDSESSSNKNSFDEIMKNIKRRLSETTPPSPLPSKIAKTESNSLAAPPPPPPPPPPMMMSSQKRNPLLFKNCPLTPVSSVNENSLFASIELDSPETVISDIFGSMDAMKEHYGLAPPKPTKQAVSVIPKPPAADNTADGAEVDRRDSALSVGSTDDGVGKSIERLDSEVDLILSSGPILPDRLSKHIDLIVRQTKLSVERICAVVHDLDESAIPAQIVKEIMKSKPEKDDLRKMELINGSNPARLKKPELFIVKLMQVPLYEQRLKVIYFLSTYVDLVKDVEYQLDNVISGCFEIERHVESFKLLFKYAAAVSTTMNKGRLNASSKNNGFRFADLIKLSEVMSNVSLGDKLKPVGTGMAKMTMTGNGKQQQKPMTLLNHLLLAAKKFKQDFSLGKKNVQAASVSDLSFKCALASLEEGIADIGLVYEEEKNQVLRAKMNSNRELITADKDRIVEKSKIASALFKRVLVRFNEMDMNDLVLPTTPEAFFTSLNELQKVQE